MVSGSNWPSSFLAVQIKAVTFDVGGTLIEPWPSVGHVYAKVAAEHGFKNVSPDMLNARFRAAWKARPGFAHSRAAWAELVDEVFAGLVPDRPSRTFFPGLYDRFAEPDAWRIFADVIPALETLASRGIRLAVISNWDERLPGLLRTLKLDHYFETLAVSYEVGFAKPSHVIFEHAALKLGLSINTILHIGDSPEMDVCGAKAAGAAAFELRRGAASLDGNALSSLADLAAKIENLSKQG